VRSLMALSLNPRRPAKLIERYSDGVDDQGAENCVMGYAMREASRPFRKLCDPCEAALLSDSSTRERIQLVPRAFVCVDEVALL